MRSTSMFILLAILMTFSAGQVLSLDALNVTNATNATNAIDTLNATEATSICRSTKCYGDGTRCPNSRASNKIQAALQLYQWS